MSTEPSHDRYVVIGNPVDHSRSPQIHKLFAAQLGVPMQYEKMLVPPGGLAQALTAFAEQGGCGANITIPFKHDACRLVDTLSPRARRADAVNTVSIDSDGVHGDNTDGIGLTRDLAGNLDWLLTGQNILLIGAGGAACGVIESLLAGGPTHLTIANRTVAKAQYLAARFADFGNVDAATFAELDGISYQLVINATSASLSAERPAVPDNIVTRATRCYDLMYASQPTTFMRWASQQGAMAVSDGLGMLVEQAGESFKIWRGIRPDTRSVIAELRQG